MRYICYKVPAGATQLFQLGHIVDGQGHSHYIFLLADSAGMRLQR